MSTTPRRGPSERVEARDLKTGDYIPARKWTVLATQELDGGSNVEVNATSSGGLVRRKVLPSNSLVEVIRAEKS